MDIITSIIENFAITLLGGTSVVALVFYFYFKLHPEEMACAKLQGLIYKILLIGMFLVFSIAIFNIFLYLYDGNISNSLEYFVKGLVVLVVFSCSILLTKHIISKEVLVPIIVGCWQFLALFHFFVNVVDISILNISTFLWSIFALLSTIAISFGIFFSILHFISHINKKEE